MQEMERDSFPTREAAADRAQIILINIALVKNELVDRGGKFQNSHLIFPDCFQNLSGSEPAFHDDSAALVQNRCRFNDQSARMKHWPRDDHAIPGAEVEKHV